jgi:hypothetical protein
MVSRQYLAAELQPCLAGFQVEEYATGEDGLPGGGGWKSVRLIFVVFFFIERFIEHANCLCTN